MSFQNANILIQQFVDRYGNRDRTYEVINFVRDVSQANRKVTLTPETFLRGPGKLRSVRLNYFPILCDTEGSCDTNICDTGTVVEPAQIMFDIDKCTASKIYAINKDDIRLVDHATWDFTGTALEIITSALPDLRRQLALDWLTFLYTLEGVHRDGTAEKLIAPVNNANGIVNAIGLLQIRKEYMDGGFSVPYVLGGDDIYYLQQMTRIGGLNAQGQVINRVDTNNTYYDDGLSDQILNDLANGGHILSIAPEIFKYVWYSENAGIFRTDLISINDLGVLYRRGTGGAFIEGTLVDPVTGLVWDLYVRYDECTQQWNFQLKHRWNFFVMPDVACNVQGVNGIMHWRTCPAILPECPAGSPIPSPAAAQTFTWEPNLATIPIIANSIIGGVQNQPNSPVAITSVDDVVAYMNANYAPIFTESGGEVTYTGYSAISGSFNNGDVTFTFA